MTDRVTGWPYEWFLFVYMAISGCKLVQALLERSKINNTADLIPEAVNAWLSAFRRCALSPVSAIPESK
jgi:hypothetical protein